MPSSQGVHSGHGKPGGAASRVKSLGDPTVWTGGTSTCAPHSGGPAPLCLALSMAPQCLPNPMSLPGPGVQAAWKMPFLPWASLFVKVSFPSGMLLLGGLAWFPHILQPQLGSALPGLLPGTSLARPPSKQGVQAGPLGAHRALCPPGKWELPVWGGMSLRRTPRERSSCLWSAAPVAEPGTGGNE